MTARILVVDDIAANRKMLATRLQAEYFEVETAADGRQAIDICTTTAVDLVLLDIMMPGLDGYEVCRFIKSDPRTMHIPVIMITALDQLQDRVKGLQAGADDFLSKPVNETQLVARVKSLVRLKTMTDELRVRAQTAMNLGIEKFINSNAELDSRKGLTLLVSERGLSRTRLKAALRKFADVTEVADPGEALSIATGADFELVIVDARLASHDPLRLCSQLRSNEATRFIPLLLICQEGDEGLVHRALDLGVNDYILAPVDPNELIARCRTQFKRKRFNDHLRSSVQNSITLSVTDPLTGLYNRRYLDSHLVTLIKRAQERGRALSIIMLDVDRFKLVNDEHGHDAGDAVLTEFATRIRGVIRGIDLSCRIGGEEFVIVLPDTSANDARMIAERLRQAVENAPFRIGKEAPGLNLTASFGVSGLVEGDSAASLIKRADTALLAAKRAGRNLVISKMS
ncbi:MAG: PleD family two-component system response regulator [Rhizobiaceae bacterium MnEN-MB40S]|nr:MAG: PleD family two-component system response regulator [Rhizobiaceae bacterium MnEN-MB40S]